MRLPPTLTRSAMRAAHGADLSVDEVARKYRVPPQLVRTAAYRSGYILRGQRTSAPLLTAASAEVRERVPMRASRCGCGMWVLPAPLDRMPVRCCLCRAAAVERVMGKKAA